MTHTRWYARILRPVRVGWYERRYAQGVIRDWWDGARWRVSPGGVRLHAQRLPWRGLVRSTKWA